MAGISTVGTCVAFAAAEPATIDQAGYEALAWTEWPEITQIGDYGGQDDVSKVTPTCSGIVTKIHGPRDNGTQNMEALYDKASPGQILVRAAYQGRTVTSVRITYPDGAVDYYTGIVTSAIKTPGSASDIVMIKPTLEVSSQIVEVL